MKPKANSAPLDQKTRDKIKRAALFVPCDTKEHLHTWIKVYLGIDLPDCIVCDDDVTNPPSNSSPMDLVWEIYSKAKEGTDEHFQSVLAYANRSGYKTVACSVLEILAILHLDRNVVHAAAIESQASICQQYIAEYFRRPYLRDFITSKNKRLIEVAHFHGPDGEVINQEAWEDLPPEEKDLYVAKTNSMKIAVCTIGGMNGLHGSLLVLDELDLANSKALQEANGILSKGFNGELPIKFMTSSRKFSFGEVQKSLDNAHKLGLIVRHWNILDVTERCKPERHLPHESRIPIYYNEKSLASISEAEFTLLASEEQLDYNKLEGYAGCLANCNLFAVCRGRLATKQTSSSKLLISVAEVRGKVQGASVEFVKAQLLCWKPSAEGLIYPNFSRERHCLSAAEMAEKITGEKVTQPHFNKADLVALMMRRGMEFHAGADWGYSHNFSVVMGALDGNRLFVFDVIAAPGLETTQKVELTKQKYWSLNAAYCPDNASPADIKSFKRAGFRMRRFTKDLMMGIEAVRSKLMPGLNREPEIFFLRGDPGVELLCTRLAQYHWIIEQATERPTETPDDTLDDECFTDQTEALTRRGWISLAAVADDDEVMAVDDRGVGHWERPEAVIHKTYSGRLYEADHHHLQFSATENHRHSVMTQSNWRVKKEYLLEKRTVDEMVGEMYWANNLSDWPQGPGLFEAGEKEAWLAGFWLAEGCFDSSRPSFLIFDQTKEPNKFILRRRIIELGWRYSETINGSNSRFVCSEQTERAKAWRSMFGCLSHQKRLLPDHVWQMTAQERFAFWDGYMAGDGSRTKRSSWHFDSVSKELIDGVQVLTMALGPGCRIVSYDCMAAGRLMTNPQGRTYTTRQSYRGHVLQKTAVTHLKKSRITCRQVTDVPVHCVRTSTGSFLARTNGKPFVAGNCDALRYVCQVLFGVKTRFAAALHPSAGGSPEETRTFVPDNRNWMENKIRDLTNGEQSVTIKGRRGSFIFDV